ncbi:MAG: FAD-dependent oxidoreductase [Bacilli bacterium]|nr:FAD-dependent oxidoreductase [Bacilli bacterium]
MYNIIIIGAGVVGAQVARRLARYKLDILVLEKENDVGDGASGANSAIVHSGYDPEPGTLKAKLNVLGNQMYDEICKDLDVEMYRIGSLTLSNSEEDDITLQELLKRAKLNNVEARIVNKEELQEMEPNITSKARCALFAPTAGIINPFELVVALMENAIDNGVKLHLSEEVTSIERIDDHFKVNSNKGSYETDYVINCAGVYSDKVSEMVNPKFFNIVPKRGEYYVLDHFDKTYVKHTLFNVPSAKGKGVLVSPTTHFNYLVGPSSEVVLEKDDVSTDQETLQNVKTKAYDLVDNLRLDKQIRQFSGMRAVSDINHGDFIIEETSHHFINCAGIQSPGLASSPAIALMVDEMIPNKELKKDYNPKRRPLYRLNNLSFEERCKLVKEDPKFGHIVCRCEKVSEAEVLDAIRRNCGARTIKGVKKRVRPGFGKCQGGFCEPIILDILAKELGKDKTEITYGKDGSYILEGRTKGE